MELFTGLVEEMGTVRMIQGGQTSSRLTIEANRVLEGISLGDSISTNGVCLTVVGFNAYTFTVDVMPETMRRSSLKNLRVGMKVNLERATRLGDRLGGHIVTGHIDGIGTVIGLKDDINARWVTVKTQKDWMKYIVEKGSIAIDGVSLTVAEVGDEYFKVSLIPITREETILQHKRVGDEVNLEFDILGKYVAKMLGYEKQQHRQMIDEAFLINNGF